MTTAADDLTRALHGLAAELSAADDQALADGIGALARFRTACDALWLQLVDEAEQRGLHRRLGARDTASWLAGVVGERRGAVRRDVELASQLSQTPVVADALTGGTVSKAKAAELVRAGDLPDEVQAALVADAVRQPVEQVAAAVQQARLAHGAAPPAVTPTATVTRGVDHARIEATVDLVDGEILDVALTTMVEAMGLPTDVPYTQRRAAALVGLARYYLDHQDKVMNRVGRPHVLVLVDLEVLEARVGGTATLASGAVITREQARQLADDANISRIITKGRSEILDVGRSTRTATPAIARGVIARDRHCRYQGCSAPPDLCQIHHRQSWSQRGPTSLVNMGLLCWFHHHLIHHRGAHLLREDADGRWTLDGAAVAA
jgi:hypothetical protein